MRISLKQKSMDIQEYIICKSIQSVYTHLAMLPCNAKLNYSNRVVTCVNASSYVYQACSNNAGIILGYLL